MTAQFLFKYPIGQRLASLVLMIFASLVGSGLAQAAISGDQIDSEEDLKRYVAANTDRMVDRLDELRGKYGPNDEAFYEEMEEELTGFVDFRRIAARVMGRYARQASPGQRDAFVEKFKTSLFDTYAGALAETSDFRIRVDNARFLSEDKGRASVNLTVISGGGKNYNVNYSLFKNKEGRWMMENIIIEGVNIGLAFRDRFQQEMEKYRGDVQAVISNWSGEVEELEEKAADDGAETDRG